jgi:hypothetical protein
VVKRTIGAFLLVLVLAAAPTGVGPIGSTRPAAALLERDIGGGDTLVFLTPWETQLYLARLTRYRFPGPNCGLPFAGKLAKLVKLANRACAARKAVANVQYLRMKWYLYNATLWGGCGGFIVHKNALGELSSRPAQAWDGDSYSAYVRSNVGEATAFKTSNGSFWARCEEYASPSTQSPIRDLQPVPPPVRRRVPPPQPSPDSGTHAVM